MCSLLSLEGLKYKAGRHAYGSKECLELTAWHKSAKVRDVTAGKLQP